MQLRDFITESFKKEYSYRVKIAADCGPDHMKKLKTCLEKYNLVSAAKWKRTPIEENPVEFVRAKGVKFVSEVCATDIVLKYPINERILEVWLAVNLGIPHERVLAYGVKEPRRLQAEIAAERVAADKDRDAKQDDAVLANEDQAHYVAEQEGVENAGPFYGAEFNAKFLAELQRIKDEKGADYFRRYPTKDELMGDNLKPIWDTLNNGVNMGRGTESTKEVDVISQASRRN
jgi:hypothetical protein